MFQKIDFKIILLVYKALNVLRTEYIWFTLKATCIKSDYNRCYSAEWWTRSLDICSDLHEALLTVIWLYWSAVKQSGLIMLLLLFWMRHLCYLASSVTMVTSLHSRLLCGRGLEGREEEGLIWELHQSDVLTKSTLFSELQTAALRSLEEHLNSYL